MIKKITLTLTLLFTFILTAQNLKSPAEFLGYEIGTQFTRHADVVRYFDYVAQNSDWVTYQEYGKTNERRPLTYAVVTTPENLTNLEIIRTNQLKNAGILSGDATPDKAIVWLSYNVHGNEASSTEASMATLYELITTKKDWLKNTVVIIDPCVNPDGRDRYVNWYNQVKATPYDKSQDAAEHHELWPGGRPNHYLFDLNRDWAWATQVETRQRLKLYNKWMPHVHVDFHEQGINQPYYFAPAAEPYHEIITDFQHDFQDKIGKNNAKYFDKEGWLFFTKERFDLLYPSYGDTYPMYMGAIGMTFEQAGHGRAGLGINTDEGFELTLVNRVAHHKTTGLSTVEVASKNIESLNAEFKKYFNNSALKYKSYVLKGNLDNLAALTELLDKHEIKYGYADNGKVSGFSYLKNDSGSMNYEHALVVSTNQPKGKMVKVLFEPDAKLNTPITYDITAWSLPEAYGLEAVASTSLITANEQDKIIAVNNIADTNAAGYIAKWDSMNDAQFLADLLTHDIRVRFTEKPFSNAGVDYGRGSLVISKSDNKKLENFDNTVVEIANKHKRQIATTVSSFASAGPDFGSPDIKLINKQRVALLKGEQVSSLSYGATWQFFEQQLGYPVTSIDTDYFSRINLDDYDVLIMPSGYYNSFITDNITSKLKTWVKGGGKIIAIGNAVNALAGKDGFGIKENEKKSDKKDADSTASNIAEKLIPYASREEASTKDLITGSIFKTTVDATHPMAFGYGDTYYSLKLGDDSFSLLKDDNYNVAYINDNPENVSGFAGADAKAGLKNSLIFGEVRMGSGSIIYMVDDPLFRAFWQNGKLFFVNSIFFVNNNKFRI
ncbi:MAG: M14 family metallopeptidase [Leeuwenhoekiella sp.]